MGQRLDDLEHLAGELRVQGRGDLVEEHQARSRDQSAQNVPAGDLEAPAELFDQMTPVTDELKQKLGPDPDMWLSESRFR